MKRFLSFWLNLILLLAGVAAAFLLYNVSVKRTRMSMVQVELESIAEYQIRGRLQSVEFLPSVWGNLIQASGGKVADFSNRSENILKEYDQEAVESMLVAPGGIIQYVYPYTFSGQIGLDIENESDIKDIALRSRYTGLNTVSAPVKTEDGDYRLYICHPVYIKDKLGNPEFWGYSIVTVRMSGLIGELGLENMSMHSSLMLYRLDSQNGDQVLMDDTGGRLDDPVRHYFSVANGTLVLEGMWEGGWITNNERFIEFGIGLIVLFLGAMFLMNIRIRKNMKTLSQISYTDELTGLNNRHMLRKVFEELEGTRRHVSMLFVDFDHFKDINDTKGHDAGDAALKQGADFFASVFGRESCFRFGGDEFLMMMTDISDEEANAKAARLKEFRVVSFQDEEIPVSLSGGIASADCSSVPDLRTLLRLADDNLYSAKQHGRDQIVGGAV